MNWHANKLAKSKKQSFASRKEKYKISKAVVGKRNFRNKNGRGNDRDMT